MTVIAGRCAVGTSDLSGVSIKYGSFEIIGSFFGQISITP
jgi:hypothetical protein